MDNYLGEIRIFAGDYAPQDWALCDGSLLSISEYSALYSLIGVSWGGDNVTTFALPDLRGRLPVGQGAGPGLTPRTVAQTAGTETAPLGVAEIPAHNHALMATENKAITQTPGPTVVHAAAAAPTAAPAGIPYVVNITGAVEQVMSPQSIGDAGGNQPHPNLMPALALNFIIALTGVFPAPAT